MTETHVEFVLFVLSFIFSGSSGLKGAHGGFCESRNYCLIAFIVQCNAMSRLEAGCGLAHWPLGNDVTISRVLTNPRWSFSVVSSFWFLSPQNWSRQPCSFPHFCKLQQVRNCFQCEVIDSILCRAYYSQTTATWCARALISLKSQR